MDIGIIGSGRIGSILARRLAALGHQVRVANSRGRESLAPGDTALTLLLPCMPHGSGRALRTSITQR